MSENQIEIIGNRDVELLEKNRKINIKKLFTQEGMDSMIAEIQKETAGFTADITTKKGRDEIKSMAAKVARCKAPIKELATELKEDSRKFIDGVNAQLKRYETEMDTLRDAIRKPVDEIERQERLILESRLQLLNDVENCRGFGSAGESSEKILEIINFVRQKLEVDWGDFAFKAETTINAVIATLEERLIATKKYEADQAELAQLKKEKEERDKKDREAEIARQAEEKAKRDAEAEIERVREEKRIAEEKAILSDRKNYLMKELGLMQDRFGNFIFPESGLVFIKPEEILTKDFDDWLEIFNTAKAKLKIHAEEIEAEKEKLRIAAEKKAKEDAEKAAAAAVEKERLRVAEEKRKEEEAEKKREANKRHRAKIEKEAVEFIRGCINGMFSEEAKKLAEEHGQTIDFAVAQIVVQTIAQDLVPHVKINY